MILHVLRCASRECGYFDLRVPGHFVALKIFKSRVPCYDNPLPTGGLWLIMIICHFDSVETVCIVLRVLRCEEDEDEDDCWPLSPLFAF